MKQRKKTLKIWASAFMALLLAASAIGCGGESEETAETAPTPTPVPSVLAGGMPTPTPEPTETPEPTADPLSQAALSSEVTQTAAYYFPDLKTLYVAVEFTNTGDTNATVESVSVEISLGGSTVSQAFVPAFADMDIIEPGATATVAGWFSYDGTAPEEGAEIVASANVALKATAETQQKALSFDNLLIVQNYPGFATVSGCMTNLSETEDYNLTTVYLSFYDEEGKLLGMQYFSKNLQIPAGGTRDFVYHLRSLPIPSLTENTAVITARGMGIN